MPVVRVARRVEQPCQHLLVGRKVSPLRGPRSRHSREQKTWPAFLGSNVRRHRSPSATFRPVRLSARVRARLFHSDPPGGLLDGGGSLATLPLGAGMPQIPWDLCPPGECASSNPESDALETSLPMPAIAHMICHGCGAHSEGLAPSKGASVVRCRCGGVRQIVRIVRHPRGGGSASLEDLERTVQERATDETLTPSRKEQ
jgi:hypothetical protein